MARQNITKNQHYIPKMVLKRHACTMIPVRDGMIYQYDKLRDMERLVSISKVCRARNLYEFRDDEGELLRDTINCVEDRFSKLEDVWNHTIEHFIMSDTYSIDDLGSVFGLLIMQALRMPETLNRLTMSMQEILPGASYHLTNRYVKISTFLRNNGLPEDDWIFKGMLGHMLARNLRIVRSTLPFVLSGDKPVSRWQLFETGDNYNDIYCFPVSCNLCFILTPRWPKSDDIKVDTVSILDESVRWLNRRLVENSERFVYAAKPIKMLI